MHQHTNSTLNVRRWIKIHFESDLDSLLFMLRLKQALTDGIPGWCRDVSLHYKYFSKICDIFGSNRKENTATSDLLFEKRKQMGIDIQEFLPQAPFLGAMGATILNISSLIISNCSELALPCGAMGQNISSDSKDFLIFMTFV